MEDLIVMMHPVPRCDFELNMTAMCKGYLTKNKQVWDRNRHRYVYECALGKASAKSLLKILIKYCDDLDPVLKYIRTENTKLYQLLQELRGVKTDDIL